jgi:hypothetical protein
MPVGSGSHDVCEARAVDNIEDDGQRERRRRARSIAIALVLAGLVILFYVATIVRLGGSVLDRAL